MAIRLLPELLPEPAPQVEVVVPVYNEARVLRGSIARLHAFLSEGFPFTWRIVIVDNASSDATPLLAARLASQLAGVQHLRLDVKGRGRALRAAWLRSDAQILCYMDADLSTDLRALLPLVAPLLSGHSDLAIGTRLASGAKVVRGPKRELISRAYNRLLRATLRARFSDAQCGFKAGRAHVLRALLPDVHDERWFFDTELLVQAQRRGLRIHEVPVDWVDDEDSTVDIVATAWEDLRGIARLAAQSQVARFMAIGIASTIAYAIAFLSLRGLLGPGGANGLALAITAVANTQANRRLTFGVRGRTDLLRHHLQGAVVFVLTLALTSAALQLQQAAVPHASRLLELAVLVVASICATATRFVALRSWVFARGRVRRSAPQVTLRPD